MMYTMVAKVVSPARISRNTLEFGISFGYGGISSGPVPPDQGTHMARAREMEQLPEARGRDPCVCGGDELSEAADVGGWRRVRSGRFLAAKVVQSDGTHFLVQKTKLRVDARERRIIVKRLRGQVIQE